MSENTSEAHKLVWSSQLTVTTGRSASKLQGDKILLPQSALEQLLAAATTTELVDAPSQSYTTTFDPFNPYTFATERQARSQLIERNQRLPHPLTFRLVNPENGNVVYAGVREFSAEPGEVGLSNFLREALGISDKGEASTLNGEDRSLDGSIDSKITIHAEQLPKGKYVRFRPLEAGYDPEDWKALLEHYMRDTFTTLTKGELLIVPAGKEEFRFLVDKLAPEGDAVCIVDTDLEVDIEALNEEQARETLKRRLKKSQRSKDVEDGDSTGGKLATGKTENGQVLSGHYVDYNLQEWDRSKDIEVELSSADEEGAIDLFVSPLTSKQRARPREDEYVFGDFSGRPNKKVRISHTHSQLEGAEALFVSVHAYQGKENDDGVDRSLQPVQYSLCISTVDNSPSTSGQNNYTNSEIQPHDEVRCKNCHQWVPQRTLFLHENFCLRNNVLCTQCNEVFQRRSSDWQNHWHCPHDEAHGRHISTRQKHDILYHMSKVCSNCGYQANNTPDLAHHRTSTCPGKLILCQFCHLLVPQQGPDDLSPSDPEVIFSGITPHELSDGARTTECHLCGKITRLRDMTTHLRHHDLERISRLPPRICRNGNCGNTMEGVGHNGEVKRSQPSRNDLGVCDACFGPLYNSSFDPEGKALRRRVERRYLTQMITGCGKDWCRNEYCKTGRKHLGPEISGESVGSKEALGMIKPIVEKLKDGKGPLHFCTDEASQKRRILAEMVAAEGGTGSKGEEDSSRGKRGGTYDVRWCVAALEAENGDLGKARTWLGNWAPTIVETTK